jgi:hypothetical protein
MIKTPRAMGFLQGRKERSAVLLELLKVELWSLDEE